MHNIILLSLILVSSPVYAGQERGGGITIERNFVEYAQAAAKGIAGSLQAGEKYFEGFNLAEFQRALDTTEVKALPNLCKTLQDSNTGKTWAQCLDAEYYSNDKRIEFSSEAWNAKGCMDKLALTIHELGRASGNENGNYKYSSQVIFSGDFRDICKDFSSALTCDSKVQYLEQSLRKAVAEIPEDYDFIVQSRYIILRWVQAYAQDRCTQAEAMCMNVCYPKGGESCFSVCAILRPSGEQKL